jgi:hypothetical protein
MRVVGKKYLEASVFSPYVVGALVPAVSAALVNAVFTFW